MKKRKNTVNPANWQLATRLVRGGRLQSGFGETSEALYLNSSYSYASAEKGQARFEGSEPGFKYGRYSHPNLDMLQERLTLMEEGAEACIVTGSGMSAVFAALICQLKAGDHVVGSRALFSSCHYIITEILPRFGITTTLVDGPDNAAWKKAINGKTRCVFLESPANPALELVDIAAVAALCKQHKACLIVDNVFAAPPIQSPLKLGADVVVYSTTKHLDGQGRTLGGAILGKKKFIENTLMPFVRHTGPHMSPFNAWVLLKSLETLPLRMAQHCANAKRLATVLEEHPKVTRLLYPHSNKHPQYKLAKKQMTSGGPMIALELKGGKTAAFRFMNALTVFDISNNLGNAKSLATHPASTTHASMDAKDRKAVGITDGLVRLSVGIEDIRDLEADILSALKGV
ncbi:MAG: PLP-dependent aspartate aminotransferase family protein [Alphaproteobacteria bacterium]